MSYDIVYDKRFIATSRGVIPMVLIGSSNVYVQTMDSKGRSREVRERHWSTIHDQMIENAEGMSKWLETASSSPEHELFQDARGWVLGKDIRKWFASAIKHAKKLEEYLTWNPTQSFRCEVRWYAHKDDFGAKSALYSYCHNTEELESWIDSAKEFKQKTLEEHPRGLVYIAMGFDGNEKLATCPNIDKAVVVKCKNAYISEYVTGTSRTFSSDPEDAIVFESIEHAIRELGITPNANGDWNKVTFVKAESAKKKKPWVLRVNGGCRDGQYIKRITSGYIYFTNDPKLAHHYPERHNAKTVAKKIINRFRIATTEFAICNVLEHTEETFDAAANCFF